jgi:DHA2 family multidrug resistance protein
LPRQPEARSPAVDYPGIFLMASFLMPLLLGISFARDSETATSTLVLLGLTGLIGGSLFVVRELYIAFPAVNLRLFRQPIFCLLCCSGFFNSMGLFGALFMVPIFLQQVLGLTPWQASLLLLPAIPVSAFSGLISGRLSDRFPPSVVAIAGLLIMVVIFRAFASVTASTTVAVLVGYLVLYRAFMDTVGIPITSLTMQTLPVDEARMGQGLLGVLRSIGASLGVTMTSVFFERRRTFHQFQAYSYYDQTSSTHESTLLDMQQWLHDAGLFGSIGDQEALDTIRQQMDIEAIAVSFQESFLFISLCFMVSIIPMLWLLSRRLRAPVPVA